MTARQAIAISETLYQCRDQQLFLSGEEKFDTTVQTYKPTFESVMSEENCNELQALIVLLQRAKGHESEGMLIHVLCAVACELLEPMYIKKESKG